MRKFKNGLIATALVALAMGNASAQEKTLRFAYQNVAETPQGQGAVKFAELVKQKSGGKMDVRLFAGGTLGGDLQTVSALQGGTIDLTVLNAGLLVGLDKQFALLDLPFLFNTPEEADAIVDGPIGQKLVKGLEEKGLMGLGYWELGFRQTTNSRRPITKVEDFKGLKLRVLQSPLFIDLFNKLGANAVPLPFPEVYAALEQKVVDGQENPYPTILGAKLSEVQKYLSNTRHIYNAQAFLISKKTWDGLSAEQRKIISDSAMEAQAFQRKFSRDSMNAALAELKKSGMEANDLSPAEMNRLREAVKPVIDKFSKESGEAVFAEIQSELAKLRK